MMMTTIANLSEDAGRIFEIEVTGSTRQARLRTSAYKVRVPYATLSKTIRSIAQRGGKIVAVKMLGKLEAEGKIISEDTTESLPLITEKVEIAFETVKSLPSIAEEVEIAFETVESSQPIAEKVEHNPETVESLPLITEKVESIPAIAESLLPSTEPTVVVPITVKPTNNRPASARGKHSKSKKR